jgi:hypothetical protein
MKQFALVAVKLVAGVAAIVFIVANPIATHGGIPFFVSIPVLLVCFFLWLLLGGGPSGYWPNKPQ